jgi:hypothetical protein
MGRKQMRRRYGGFSGRPGDLPPAGNEWQSTSCFSRNSKGWLPEMKSLQQGRLRAVRWGRVGMENPQSMSGEEAGFNTQMWQGDENVADALSFLGYEGRDGSALLRQFQSDWNRVSQRVGIHPRFKAIHWKQPPTGNLIVDGRVGPLTLNALEIAIFNQDVVPWRSVVAAASNPDDLRLGRKHLYSAK